MTFKVRGGHIVQDQTAFLEMAASQSLLNGALAYVQPIQGCVQLALVDVGQIEFLDQGAQRGFLAQTAGRRELGARLQDASNDHRHSQVALGAALWVKVLVEADLPQSSEDGGDMSVGLTPDDLEALGEVLDDGAAAQKSP